MGLDCPINQQKSTYRIDYIVEEPSKFSDYDYDPFRPERRYISTYIHKLVIYDNILNQKLLTVHFSSETCAELLRVLYACTTGFIRVATIHNVYTDIEGDIPMPATFTITEDNFGLFHINITCKELEFHFQFVEDQLEQVIKVIETSEVEHMYLQDEDI